MSQHNVHLLDLPNEILFIILKKLDNMDVLYSLLDINNQQLDFIAQDKIFTNILDFVSISSSNDISSTFDRKLDRFCTKILPRIQHNVKCLILDSVFIDRIFLAAAYPNLIQLKLLNFNKKIVSRYFRDDSRFQHICKQITDLILIGNENKSGRGSKYYTMDVYAIILIFFKNLKHLIIVPSSINYHPPLSLNDLPPTTFFSSILTKLCIHVLNFDDCLALLDGRLEQLNTFIVQIHYISYVPLISHKTDKLCSLKCFSLICYGTTCLYDELVVPLLHRMSHLEELTLYVCIKNRFTFVHGTHLHNEILIYMPRLHTFTFYISTEIDIYAAAATHRISNDDIQRTFANTNLHKVACIVDYDSTFKPVCHVFSLPFTFDRLEQITNYLPSITFRSVIHLGLQDNVPFKHEFFIRVARAFPSLKSLSVKNLYPSFWIFYKYPFIENYSYSIVEYPHLISLDTSFVDIGYVDQFLNESKTHLPCLTELKVPYDQLKSVTENFTRNATRRNCAKMKRLIVEDSIVLSEDVYRYFPSL